ncbi:MAG TPA: hypothetical protein VEJ16_03090 [Alphaproteobacteria bacterium]|nr:hypothetical protein [Alphaproteobacteria bacterium]
MVGREPARGIDGAGISREGKRQAPASAPVDLAALTGPLQRA